MNNEFPEFTNKRITVQPYGNLYDINYVDDIGEPSEYLDDFHVYRNTTVNDIIKVHVNTNGGDFETTVQIVNNMRMCQAKIITILEGSANSAGSIIFLEGDEYIITEHAEMLIHESILGVFDSSHKAATQFYHKLERVRNAFSDYYKEFLSKEEMEKILTGGDVWLNAEEIQSRLEIKCSNKGDKEWLDYLKSKLEVTNEDFLKTSMYNAGYPSCSTVNKDGMIAMVLNSNLDQQELLLEKLK